MKYLSSATADSSAQPKAYVAHSSVLLWWKWYGQDSTVNCNDFNLQKSIDYIFFLVRIEMHIVKYQPKFSHFVFYFYDMNYAKAFSIPFWAEEKVELSMGEWVKVSSSST